MELIIQAKIDFVDPTGQILLFLMKLGFWPSKIRFMGRYFTSHATFVALKAC